MNFRSRRLVSRFRCGCHGLHVGTGNFKPVGRKVDRQRRFVLACDAATAEDAIMMNTILCLTALHIVQSVQREQQLGLCTA